MTLKEMQAISPRTQGELLECLRNGALIERISLNIELGNEFFKEFDKILAAIGKPTDAYHRSAYSSLSFVAKYPRIAKDLDYRLVERALNSLNITDKIYVLKDLVKNPSYPWTKAKDSEWSIYGKGVNCHALANRALVFNETELAKLIAENKDEDKKILLSEYIRRKDVNISEDFILENQSSFLGTALAVTPHINRTKELIESKTINFCDKTLLYNYKENIDVIFPLFQKDRESLMLKRCKFSTTKLLELVTNPDKVGDCISRNEFIDFNDEILNAYKDHLNVAEMLKNPKVDIRLKAKLVFGTDKDICTKAILSRSNHNVVTDPDPFLWAMLVNVDLNRKIKVALIKNCHCFYENNKELRPDVIDFINSMDFETFFALLNRKKELYHKEERSSEGESNFRDTIRIWKRLKQKPKMTTYWLLNHELCYKQEIQEAPNQEVKTTKAGKWVNFKPFAKDHWEIEIPSSSAQLKFWGSDLVFGNCVASYADYINKGQSVVFAVKENGNYTHCVEIDPGSYKCKQFVTFRNKTGDAALRQAVLKELDLVLNPEKAEKKVRKPRKKKVDGE